MSDLQGTVLFSTDGPTGATTGPTKFIKVPDNGPRHAQVQISIEAGASGAVKVTIEGRANSSAPWVALDKQDDSTEASVTQSGGAQTDVVFPVQLMPQMRAVTSGTFTATVGNDVDVWINADQNASRTNS
jgi:type 1 fimbria pilin